MQKISQNHLGKAELLFSLALLTIAMQTIALSITKIAGERTCHVFDFYGHYIPSILAACFILAPRRLNSKKIPSASLYINRCPITQIFRSIGRKREKS